MKIKNSDNNRARSGSFDSVVLTEPDVDSKFPIPRVTFSLPTTPSSSPAPTSSQSMFSFFCCCFDNDKEGLAPGEEQSAQNTRVV